MSDRNSPRHAFLQRAGWDRAASAFLAGDASDRSYDRLTRGTETAVLMEAPPGSGDDPATFIAVADHLARTGLSAPQLLAADLPSGFLLLEDFGDAVFAKVIEAAPAMEPMLYTTALDALQVLQSNPAMPGLPALSLAEWAAAAALVIDQYRGAVTDDPCDTSAFIDCLSTLLADVEKGPPVMILRDFHAENLIWLPDRQGPAKAGLLDFQLAQMGHPVYDAVSLLQDARRDVRGDVAAMAGRHFCNITGMSDHTFHTAMAVWGAQRALRILGIFARLARQQGKRAYVKLIPRVWQHLQMNLAHPQLAGLQRVCDSLLPPPTPEVLGKLCNEGTPING